VKVYLSTKTCKAIFIKRSAKYILIIRFNSVSMQNVLFISLKTKLKRGH